MAENGHSCERCREWMMDILYPEDLERIPADIRQHLDSCAACGEDFEALGRTLKLIRKVDLRIQPPPGLERSIMSAIEREAGARKPVQAPGLLDGLWEKIKRAMEAAFPVVRSPAFAAAIVLLVVAGVVLLLKDYMAGKSTVLSDRQEVQVLPPISGEEAAPAPAVPTEQRPFAGVTADKSVEAREGMNEVVEHPVAKAPVVTSGKDKEIKAAEEDHADEDGSFWAAKGKEGPKAKDLPLKLEADDEISGKKGGKVAGGEGGEAMPSGAATSTPSKADTKALGSAGLTEALDEEKSAESKKASPAGTMGGAKGAYYPTPTPAPAPEEAGVSVTGDASAGVGKQEDLGADAVTGALAYDKSTANVEAEESVAPTYAATPAEASPPPQSEAKKKGSGGGWLAKWKEKKAAKKKAKAGKAEAAVSQQASAVDKAEATKTPSAPSPASPAKEAAPAKDPYVQARDAYQSGNYDTALSVLNAVLKDPSSTTTSLAYIYHLLGKVWNKKGNTSKALVYYENLFARYPSYPYIAQARWEAAQLYIATGDKDQAKKLLEKLLDNSDYKDKAKKKLDTL